MISEIDLSQEKFKNPILRAVQSLNFVKTVEGQKFVVSVLSSNVNTIKDVHKAFKAIIPGELYFFE